MTDAFARAQSLLGVPFRPHGRSPHLGLDCIGVVLWAYEIAGKTAPRYRLSDGSWPEIEAQVSRWFEPATDGAVQEALLITQRRRCFHFAVGGPTTFIHADLRIGRIVETPLHGLEGPTRCYRRKEK